MTRLVRPFDARLSALALAMFAAFGPAWAQTGEVESSVTAGIGLVSGNRADRSLFDQYSGLRPGSNATGLVGYDYVRRNDGAGTVVQFHAIDLLNDNRELSFRWKKQGDWKLSAGYSELTRRDPNIANTGLIGAGTSTPQVSPLAGGPGSGSDLDLKVKRTSLGIAFSKILDPRWQFDISLQSENKDGARLFGIGMNCPTLIAPGCRGTTGTEAGWALLMLPEPIHSNHSQAEARVSYAGDKLRLSAGYHGSFYRNDHGSLNPVVPASLYNPVGALLPLSSGLQAILNQPVALAPDNQAHEFDLTGSYGFTRTTLLNFKLGYSIATQHQDFAASGFTAGPAGVSDLGGKLITTLAQAGLTARPLPKLSLAANLRYEDRDDETPIALYNIVDTSTFTNRRLPSTKLRVKLQAAYQLSSDYRGTLAAEHESIDRGVFTATSAVSGISALRQKTAEDGIRAELRRRMSDTFSGAISAEHSHRGGSNWLRDNSGLGVTEITDPSAAGTGFATAIFMPTLANRERDKLRLHAEWQATESLSLQLAADNGKDRFRSPSAYGVHSAAMNVFSVDLDCAISEKWSVNGYASQGRQELDQSRPGAALIAFDNKSGTLGLGFSGKPTARWEVGGMLSHIDDHSAYAQTLDASADAASIALLAASGGLPDVVFRQTTLKLFGTYALDKASSLKLQFVHQHSNWNDWAWRYNATPFVYSDGTTLNRKPVQHVSVIGISYVHRWN